MSEQMERDMRIEAQERAERLEAENKRLQRSIKSLVDIDIESRFVEIIVEYTRQKEALERIRATLDNLDMDDSVKLAGIENTVNQVMGHQIKLEVVE